MHHNSHSSTTKHMQLEKVVYKKKSIITTPMFSYTKNISDKLIVMEKNT